MRLIEYMRQEGLSDAAFAARFNDAMPKRQRCGEHAVKKWKYGERRPDADGILRIETITAGAVTLRDWSSNATKIHVHANTPTVLS